MAVKDQFAKRVGPAPSTGTDDETEDTRPLVATKPHFRQLGEGQLSLYVEGDHVPASRAELPAVAAEHVEGVWRPVKGGKS